MAIINGTNFNDNDTTQNGVFRSALIGTAGVDSIFGFAGNDILDGGIGADMMSGGDGNDVYYVDNAGDIITDTKGYDVVNSFLSYTMKVGLETLALIGDNPINGTGTPNNDDITGNDSNNVLMGLVGIDQLAGNGGNDTLDGGLGADYMEGGAGNDIYVVNDINDVADETGFLSNGVDLINASISYVLDSELENLTLTGTAALSGTGNEFNNIINGNNGNNLLNGLAGVDNLVGNGGNDTLSGGLGKDSLNGGTGQDKFLFNAAPGINNADTITGYVAADDTITLENAIFTKFTATGIINAGNLIAKANPVAVDANDYLLYNTTTGVLSYDANGNAAGAAVQFATLVGAPAVTAADFQIV
ncbi:calcium-binding protein [Nitrosomonas sp. JL21]|uniref:calcium-binding protein n=1 Tax=Nitrosomonas sp. JL21 TaxID=153949 RepID=UPI001370CC41|nr:calcium-binding protein [Nitrosomonas sp. JL21]MBL8497497.1 calcium-binding protein [Nitrosomonas sp.]MXS78575.1 calcium-binding protein [Nitrosomonas sp. JL21]